MPRPAPIVIFDIDGTLTATSAVDGQCFVQALDEVWGVRDVEPDWSVYPHCTDRGIAGHVFRQAFGRRVKSAEVAALRERFVALLRQALGADAGRFRQTPGAEAALAALGCEGCPVGIATGGFRRSARLKLAAAGLDVRGIPFASSEDGLSRESIVRRAVRRVEAAWDGDPRGEVVSIGDGVWDVRTARNLGIPFVGIGTGRVGERLRAAGAVTVWRDLAPLAEGACALEQAALPRDV
jgi:phosphoglycolate phosphatase-like HAD superfamily hydrolase